MTPQEKDLITQLLDRLKQVPAQPKDEEAEALIKAGMAAQPDAPYLLIQTALIQNMALDNAQSRITDLERQLADAKQAAAAKPTSFLGGLLGRDTPPAQPQPAAPTGLPAAPPAPGAPWGQRPLAAGPQGFGQPMGGPGMGGPGMGGPGSGAGSFMRTAAAAAVGVAGGALLYQGISSMFGGHGTSPANAAGLTGGGPWGGNNAAASPDAASSSSLTGSQDPTPQGDQAGDAGQSNDQASDWNNNDNADYGGDDFGGGDFGGDSSDI